MRRDVFQAIADPTRRQIINIVAHKTLNLNTVAAQFEVSRPAISRHIKILTECGLVVINQKGRERFCEARVEKLNEVSDWVGQFREMWENKFDSLDNYLTQIQAKGKKGSKKPFTKKTKDHELEEEEESSSEPDNQYSLF